MTQHDKKYENMEIEQLLAAFSRCQNAVLEELYKRYSTKTYGLCIKYLGNREEAKDAVADIFIRLRMDLKNHEIKHFNSWFYIYAKNHCLGQLRKAKTIAKHEEIWEIEKNGLYAQPRISESKISNLRAALEGLKADQRQCIELFFYQKHSYSEIAGQLSISEKKVKSHLQNGKRNLRLILENIKQPINQKNNG